ncbi:all trans-polyprenyl-diphosphate synthase PDSS1-like [Oscarella lobularis]|uniref:all trans-polyprenyl-diphosphate synthase PDSS1-like n=1 Tax=Oscarella lobularis TaxID=121494 RepID=UPI0033142010
MRRRTLSALFTTSRSMFSQANSAQFNAKEIVRKDLERVTERIGKELDVCRLPGLKHASQYYFKKQGKLFRPLVALLMARACNKTQLKSNSEVTEEQLTVAMVSEMIHTATLVHDDVIDQAQTRRGQPVSHLVWGTKKSVFSGDYILARSSIALSRIGNPFVVELLAHVLDSLVKGEVMQLGTRETTADRFAHYMEKTFRKTASLLALSCQAVALLAGTSQSVSDLAYQYGRNLGIAFQLVDDMLDFVSTSDILGKPVAADLKLGLATAPVLFASETYPELDSLILRRFSQPNDVEKAWDAVKNSDGLQRTRDLAAQYTSDAVTCAQGLAYSHESALLIALVQEILSRKA